MKNTYWQTPSCDLQGVQIKEPPPTPPPPPPPQTFDGFDTIQHLAGCARGNRCSFKYNGTECYNILKEHGQT